MKRTKRIDETLQGVFITVCKRSNVIYYRTPEPASSFDAQIRSAYTAPSF